ncbi:TlpA family protein disulfide reductase [Kiritimatiella glycovorans]|uniref:Thiol-disulfide oxidoreductase n=1 Tax=Kiritimatiella glycovorans TaxID=1307763 RepID=A0A0G3EIN3_9BACT|nr:TlpA disulfide reductase family protein [Kiritimatiella glycovorans]AKJ64675.1 Thiol-disulfide oxidoreductase [Kiritimatiella glycovorans]
MKKMITAMAALLLAMAVGCGAKDTGERGDASSAELTVEPAGVAEIERRIDESDKELVMVHLWATWCPPCRAEFPGLVKLGTLPEADRMEVILISVDPAGNPDQVRSFLNKYGSPWGSLIAENPGEELIRLFSKQWNGSIPATFFFGPERQRLESWVGAHSRERYEETIKDLLESGSKE